MFCSCSSSSDEENFDDKLSFIQVVIKHDDGSKVQESEGALFYHATEEINFVGCAYGTKNMYFAKSSNTSYILPVSNVNGDKYIENGSDSKVHTYYLYELSSQYGVPDKGSYYVCIKPYAESLIWKKFNVQRNSKITVTLPGKGDPKNAKWVIEDL